MIYNHSNRLKSNSWHVRACLTSVKEIQERFIRSRFRNRNEVEVKQTEVDSLQKVNDIVRNIGSNHRVQHEELELVDHCPERLRRSSWNKRGRNSCCWDCCDRGCSYSWGCAATDCWCICRTPINVKLNIYWIKL